MMDESESKMVHSKNILHVSPDINLDYDIDNYEDSRIELQAIGHNLTSVLMNPRETMFEEFVDEFEIEQSFPLEFAGYICGDEIVEESISGYFKDPQCLFNRYKMRSAATTEQLAKISRLPANAEVGYCYNNVPDVYFRTDFTAKHTDVVHAILALEEEASEDAEVVLNHATNGNGNSVLERREEKVSSKGGGSLEATSPTIGAVVPVSATSGDVRKKKADDKLTETRLTNYLDLVEVALLRQIMSKSTAFFRALDDIHNLQSMVSRAAIRIIHLRRGLRGFDNDIVSGPLRIPRLEQRRKNELLLHEKLLHMQRVLHGRRTVRTLLELDDYSGALEIISITRKLFHRHLTGIASMVSIGTQLEAYDDHIIEVMCDRFVNMATSWTESTADHMKHNLLDEEDATGDSDRAAASSSSDAVGLAALTSEYSTANHQRMQNGASDGNKHMTGALQEPLGQLLHALLHVHKLRPAMELYSTRLQDGIKLIVRTCLLEYINPSPAEMYGMSEGDNTANTGPFAQRVRNMTNENFLACLSMCYENLMQSLSRACAVHIFISDAFNDEDLGAAPSCEGVETKGTKGTQSGSGIGQESDSDSGATGGQRLGDNSDNGDFGGGNSDSGVKEGVAVANDDESLRRLSSLHEADASALVKRGEEKKWALEFSATIISNVSELCQKSINQLLIMRKETNARLQIEQMKFLWEVSSHFVTGIEHLDIGEKKGPKGEGRLSAQILRQGLLTQTKKFLEHTHESFKGKLVNTLDNERWQQCDVTPDRQAALDRLTSGRLFLIPQSHTSKKGASHTSTLPSISSTSTSNGNSTQTSSTAGSAAAADAGRKKKELACVVVDGVEYKVVWSALFLIEVMLNYLDVAVQFPLITRDVISKIVEMCSLFDNRSKQLVLGAQAIQSAARLKFIAAKHLGIMVQCLTFLQAVLPHVRAALMTHLSPEHQLTLVELDRVSKSIIEHHAKVLSKFVSIVGDFVDASSLKLRQLDWDRLTSKCEYFEEVVRNVSALHKVLLNFLPNDQMQDVFSRIFALLNRKIPEHFEEIFPSTQTGKQRITDEIVHLVTELGRLKHIDASMLTVEDAFRKKFEKR